MAPTIRTISRFLLFLLFFLAVLTLSECRKTSTGLSSVFKYKVRDTLSLYDIKFYARLKNDAGIKRLPVAIETVTPEGDVYNDTVVFLLAPSKGAGAVTKEGLWLDLVHNYRQGVRMDYKGEWIFNLQSLVEEGKGNVIREMGLVITIQGITGKINEPDKQE